MIEILGLAVDLVLEEMLGDMTGKDVLQHAPVLTVSSLHFELLVECLQ